MTTATHMTREEAINALVERDVANWGEGERTASRRIYNGLSHGRAINSLGAKLVMSDDANEAAEGKRLMAAAKKLLTAADKSNLLKGG